MDQKILHELMTKLTVNLPTAGRALCDLGRNASYEAGKSGAIAGISVIEIGKKKAVPTAPIRKMLGLEAAV
jgi:hypothetical protein